jgi:hypothetical protein
LTAPPPVFVLCPPRSCSSVIAAMLGQHPQLYGFPELFLFNATRVAELRTAPDRGQQLLRSGLTRSVAELLFGVQDGDTVGRASQWLERRRDAGPPDVFRSLLDRIAPRIGVEKSPSNAATSASLSRMLIAFPEARFVHLVRHPVSTQRSLVPFFEQVVGNPYPGVDLRTGASLLWCTYHARLIRLGRRVPPRRWLRLRAEDVLADPAAPLRSFCSWLGIDGSDAAVSEMCRAERSPYARRPPPGTSSGGRGDFEGSPVPRIGPRPLTLRYPEAWPISAGLLTETRRLAAEFGYGIPD